MGGKGSGRKSVGGRSEVDVRRDYHKYLRRCVRQGRPGAERRLQQFRARWARTFRERERAATTMEEESYWDTLAWRWERLAESGGPSGAVGTGEEPAP